MLSRGKTGEWTQQLMKIRSEDFHSGIPNTTNTSGSNYRHANSGSVVSVTSAS